MKSEIIFDLSTPKKYVSVDRKVLKFFVEALHSPLLRLKWDTNIDEMVIIDSKNKNLHCYYQRNKPPGFMISARDFLDKKLIFTEFEDESEIPCFYIYDSFIPDSVRIIFLETN